MRYEVTVQIETPDAAREWVALRTDDRAEAIAVRRYEVQRRPCAHVAVWDTSRGREVRR